MNRYALEQQVVLLCLLLFAFPATATAQDVEPVLASVVRISGTRGETSVRGSGFVVALSDDEATIVTASHVIEGATFEVIFSSSSDRFHPDVILGMDSESPNGLAVFKVRGVPAGVATLEFEAENRPLPAETLLLVGFPQRSPLPLTRQRVFSGYKGILGLPQNLWVEKAL
jgi:S1-C subfamily serine protease